MMTTDLFESPACRLIASRVRDLIETEQQSVAHRFDHLQRVARNARAIMASYPEADAEVVFLAVLLHDVDQPFDDKRNHVSRSAKLAERLLTEIEYPPARVARVLNAIREHSTENVTEAPPTTVEARILFDADKLDGLGPHGILRVFALSRQMGRPLAEAIAWYRGKIAVASANIQTPEGRAIMDTKLPLVEAFLAALEQDLDDASLDHVPSDVTFRSAPVTRR
jgi:uncharacterized protein